MTSGSRKYCEYILCRTRSQIEPKAETITVGASGTIESMDKNFRSNETGAGIGSKEGQQRSTNRVQEIKDQLKESTQKKVAWPQGQERSSEGVRKIATPGTTRPAGLERQKQIDGNGTQLVGPGKAQKVRHANVGYQGEVLTESTRDTDETSSSQHKQGSVMPDQHATIHKLDRARSKDAEQRSLEDKDKVIKELKDRIKELDKSLKQKDDKYKEDMDKQWDAGKATKKTLSEKDNTIQELNEKIVQLTQNEKSLQQKVDQQKEDMDEQWEAERAANSKALIQKKETIQELDGRIVQLTKDIKVHKANESLHEKEMEDMTKTLQDMHVKQKKESEELQTERERLKLVQQQQHGQDEENAKLLKTISELQEQLVSARGPGRKATEKKIKDLEAKVEGLESTFRTEKQQSESTICQLNGELDDAKRAAERREEDMKKVKSIHMAEIGRLTTQFHAEKKQNETTICQLTGELNDAKITAEEEMKQVKSMQTAEIGRLTTQLETERRQFHSQLEAAERATTEEKKGREQVIEQLNIHKADVGRLKSQHEKEMQDYKRQLKRQVEAAKDFERRATERKDEDMKQLLMHKLEIDKLTSQLSRDMNRRLDQDETAVEKINKKNRPTKIVDEYLELMSNQWLAVKDKLDEVYPEDDKEEFKLKLLCGILEEAEFLAHQELKAYRGFIQHALIDPVAALTMLESAGYTVGETHIDRNLLVASGIWQNQASNEGPKMKWTDDLQDFDGEVLGKNLKDMLSEFIKDHSDKPNVERLAEGLKRSLKEGGTDMKYFMTNFGDEQTLIDYMEGACALCWKMAAQRPPMTFDTSDIGSHPHRDKHEFYYDCIRDKSAVISNYVSPALVHKDKLLVKAKVFTQAEADFGKKLNRTEKQDQAKRVRNDSSSEIV